MRNSMGSILSLVLLGSACNVTTTGDRGQLGFTPDDCGQTFCSLDLTLAAGTSMVVDIAEVDGSDASYASLIADDSRVAVVFPVPLYAGDWRWQVRAIDEGRTILVALDPDGYEIDRTTLDVERPTRLGLDLSRGPAVEHAGMPVGLEVWTVTAGRDVAFRVRPLDWAGGTMMGKVDLDADVDAALFAAMDPRARIGEGDLTLYPMAPGDYGASFYGPFGMFLDVVLEVR
jgi:hypothetical protein